MNISTRHRSHSLSMFSNNDVKPQETQPWQPTESVTLNGSGGRSPGISPQRRVMGAMVAFLSVGLGCKYPIAGLVGGAVGVALMFGSEDS